MEQSRLIGLALMQWHRNIQININNVIDRFAKNKLKPDFIIKLTIPILIHCLYHISNYLVKIG